MGGNGRILCSDIAAQFGVSKFHLPGQAEALIEVVFTSGIPCNRVDAPVLVIQRRCLVSGGVTTYEGGGFSSEWVHQLLHNVIGVILGPSKATVFRMLRRAGTLD